MRFKLFCLLAFVTLSLRVQAQGPVFKITPVESKIKFDVEASVAIAETFDKWNATLTFGSTDVSSGVLNIEIQADSVDTGSGMKNGKLNGKDFFDVKQNPLITFKSTKIEQTGPRPLPSMAILRYAGSPGTRSCCSPFPARGQAPAPFQGLWPLTARNTG